MTEMLKHMGDLQWRNTTERERREMILGEKLGAGGFVAVQRNAAAELGEEEEFIDMKYVGRVAVEVAVKDGSEFSDADVVARFLTSFAGGGSGRRLADIGPTAGKRPATILEFTDEKDAAILEGGNADIDFGGGVTGLLGEERGNWSSAWEGRTDGHHLGGNVPDFVIAVNVEFVLAIGETGLGDGLEAARPGEPLWNGHEDSLAAPGKSDKLKLICEAAEKSTEKRVCDEG
jgi:hypothetical protein